MRKHFLRALGLIAAFWGAAAYAAPSAPGRVEFEVLRNGQVFGRHSVEVSQAGGDFVARSAVALRVSAGPVTLFRYEHTCSETWRAGAVASAECATLKDGRRLRMRAVGDDEALRVAGMGGDVMFPREARLTSWWIRPDADADFLVDTETGARMAVRVTRLGDETLPVAGQSIRAQRYRVEGSIPVDLWYDAEGRWIGCRFTIRGQRIEYRLTSPLGRGPA